MMGNPSGFQLAIEDKDQMSSENETRLYGSQERTEDNQSWTKRPLPSIPRSPIVPSNLAAALGEKSG